MCYPAFFAALGATGTGAAATGTTAAAAGTAGTAAAGTAAAGTAAAGTAAAGAGTAAGVGAGAAGTSAGIGAAAAKTAALTVGTSLLTGKLLTPKFGNPTGDAPPENKDSGNVASLDARRRAKIAGGQRSTLLTRSAGPVTPGQKTLLGS